MRLLLLFPFLWTINMAIGQNSPQNLILSAEEALEDYELYVRLLKETHPGLYRYSEKETMDTKIDSISRTLTDSIPFFDFYRKIAWVNAQINCSHSYVIPTKDFQSYTLKETRSVPLYVIPIRDKFYVLFNGSKDETVKPGFEITAINGMPISEIANIIKNHFWTDGKIELGHNSALQGRLFRAYYYLLIDQSEVLKFEFIDLDGKPIEKELQSVTTLTALENYQKNPVNEEVFRFYTSKQKTWDLSFPDDLPNTAIIKIPGFSGKRIRSEKQAMAKMEKFMNGALKKIHQKKVGNLILELRGNRGGWDVMGTQLMSYLLQKQDSVEYYGPSFTITNDSEFLKYSDLSHYDLSMINKELEAMPDGTFKLRSEYNLSHGWIKKKPNAFQGKVYVLMDEYTASAAAEFCAIAKSNGIATLVGQETNGTYGGLNGTSFVKLTLPNSKIVVHTPLVLGNLVVRPIQPLDRGVLPEHPVDFGIHDLLEKRDTQLEFVKNLIRNGAIE